MYVEAERKNTSCPYSCCHFAVDCYLCHMTSLCCLNSIGGIVIVRYHIFNRLCFILIEWETIEANLRTEVIEIVSLTSLYLKGIGNRCISENGPSTWAFQIWIFICSFIRSYFLVKLVFINIVLKTCFWHLKTFKTKVLLYCFYSWSLLVTHIPCIITQIIILAIRLTCGWFDVSIRTYEITSLIHDEYTTLWSVLIIYRYRTILILLLLRRIEYSVLIYMCYDSTVCLRLEYQEGTRTWHIEHWVNNIFCLRIIRFTYQCSLWHTIGTILLAGILLLVTSSYHIIKAGNFPCSFFWIIIIVIIIPLYLTWQRLSCSPKTIHIIRE